MDKSKVSVVIPVYNGERYIDSCLRGVLNQTYQNLEIIIVDDGSRDGTAAKCEAIARTDERITLIHQDNAGVSSARNAGLKAMTGDYVVFIDVDDNVRPTYIEDMVSQMDSGVGLAICGYSTATKVGDKYTLKDVTLDDEIVSAGTAIERILLYRKYNPSIWNKMFIVGVIRDRGLRFDETIAIGEDMLFLVQYCVEVERCAVIGNRNYIYFENPEGAMLENKACAEFDSKWLSEWRAIILTEDVLKSHGYESRSVKIKKIRIADKLLSRMERFGFDDAKVRKEMLETIRKNIWAIFDKDFSGVKRASIMLNCISPKFTYRLKCVFGYKRSSTKC